MLMLPRSHLVNTTLKLCTSFCVRFANANMCGEALQGTHWYETADIVT